MIKREANRGGTACSALYSPCERYRYDLSRVWAPDRPALMWIMLNPSKATEIDDDPTILRCEKRTRLLGYGAMKVCNLFALRETHPARLRQAASPVGEQNAAVVAKGASWADHILCAWGVHGTHQGQDQVMLQALKPFRSKLLVLGLTQDGHPRHPLYLPYAAKPMPWLRDR